MLEEIKYVKENQTKTELKQWRYILLNKIKKKKLSQ